MEHKNLLEELNDSELDSLMKYSIPYTEENRRNIKDKFTQKATIQQRRFSSKKFIVPVAIASILFVSTLAYAQVFDFSRIYNLVFGEKSNYIEQYIEPISKVEELPAPKTVIESEYDGIVLKLISAINDGDALRIFATMQDTTSNRLNDSIDINSWNLSQGNGGNISVIDYDSETKTATLLITSLGGHQEGNATLSINDFTTNSNFIEGLRESKINLYEILQNQSPHTMSQEEVWVSGGAYQSNDSKALAKNSDLLEFDEMNIKFDNIDWSCISNIGFVDGHLHIQTRQLSDNENHLANISFINEENETIFNGRLRLYYTDIKNKRPTSSTKPITLYTETIYEEITSIEQLKELDTVIGIVEQGNVVEGNWEFSFEIPQKINTEFMVDKEININSKLIKVDTVALSPLGITIDLPENIASDYKHKDFATVTYDDGTVITLKETYIGGYENLSTLKFSGEIIEIEKVTAININDDYIIKIK